MSTENDPPSIEARTQAHFERVRGNPYSHFVLSELQGAVSSLSVYFFFHLVSYSIQLIGEYFPLKFKEPADTLDLILTWGSVVGGGGSFCIITFFSLVTLWQSLRKAATSEH